MSQGECAYSNNGNTRADVVSSSTTPRKGLTPGVYYTLGAAVKKHLYVGGGIYNVFGEQFTPGLFPAIEVVTDITNDIDIANCMISGWVGSEHFSSMLLFKGKHYGPAMLGSSGAFYLCNLTKLVTSAPAPPPTPPSCSGLQCIISGTDYYGNIAGWPTGTQYSQYVPNMTPGNCCNICMQKQDCAYWKEGNGNCFYYTLPQSRVSHDLWKNFSSNHPSNMWTVGLRDDTCCACSPTGGNSTCGPTPPAATPVDLSLLV